MYFSERMRTSLVRMSLGFGHLGVKVNNLLVFQNKFFIEQSASLSASHHYAST